MNGNQKFNRSEELSVQRYIESFDHRKYNRDDLNVMQSLSKVDRERRRAYYEYLNRNSRYF